MANFTVSVDTPADRHVAFAYMANFDTIEEWDPGVVRARRLSDDLGVGSTFEVVLTTLGIHTPLIYEVLEYDAPNRIVLEAHTADYVSYDVITVVATETGSTVTYDATVSLKGIRRIGEPGLRLAFEVIGRRAASGLRKALAALPSSAAGRSAKA